MRNVAERVLERPAEAAEVAAGTVPWVTASAAPERKPDAKLDYVWAALRIGMGWIFLWAFIDKVFGLGYATESGKGWIDGGSPTTGFLTFGTKGPFAGFYQELAGYAVVDWLFMLGLLGIGLPLMLGIGVRAAASIGVVMLTMMYTAGFILPEHNPVLDDHIIYAVIMIGLVVSNPGYRLGLGRWWGKTKLARKYPALE
jgi:thiosulfate dehydrogenase [quinone] large subunit